MNETCECGCGGTPAIAKQTSRRNGHVKGQRVRCIYGHQPRPNRAKLFWAKVDRGGPDDCWPWTAAKDGSGYGRFYSDGGRFVGAHHWAWEEANGPVPDGLQLDHTCHDPTACVCGIACPHRACVNPSHLEPVTPAENSRRGAVVQRPHQRRRDKRGMFIAKATIGDVA